MPSDNNPPKDPQNLPPAGSSPPDDTALSNPSVSTVTTDTSLSPTAPSDTPSTPPQDDTITSTEINTTDTPLSDSTAMPPVTPIQNADEPPSFVDPSSVMLSDQTPKKYGGKKMIATIFAIALLVIGSISTVLLVQRQSLTTGLAWNCTSYVFEITRDGTVTARNGSTQNEPAQQADVFINNVLVQRMNVPALNAGQAATLGTVSVPSAAGFTWKVDGTTDCDDSGRYDSTTSPTPTVGITASCSEVKAYDMNWNLLSASDLERLKAGDVIRVAVSGTAPSGIFDKARFTINGTLRAEVSQKRPGSDEFYDQYTIPTTTSNFTVTGQIHHSTHGWF